MKNLPDNINLTGTSFIQKWIYDNKNPKIKQPKQSNWPYYLAVAIIAFISGLVAVLIIK